MSHSFARIDQGRQAGETVKAAIHRNFPLIIERNIAQMGPLKTEAWIDTMSDLELSHLAQLYANANADLQRHGLLVQLVQERLTDARLARITGYLVSARPALP